MPRFDARPISIKIRTIQNLIVLHGEQFDVRLHAEGLRLIQNTQIREILAIN